MHGPHRVARRCHHRHVEPSPPPATEPTTLPAAETPPAHASIVVIGAGIVGAGAAYHLVRRGWRDAIETEGISLMVLPTSSPLADELAREPRWELWHVDGTASVLRLRRE